MTPRESQLWAAVRRVLLRAIDMDDMPRIEIITKLEKCEHCGNLGEYSAHQCPEEMLGVCRGCRVIGVPLDRYGNCSVDPDHEITRRWYRWPRERWGR